MELNSRRCLPHDAHQALLIGRAWRDQHGPCVVLIDNDHVFDITASCPTTSFLINSPNIHELLANAPRDACLGEVDTLLANTTAAQGNYFLAPCDLQSIKACGVTFIESLLERVVEERALGDSNKANAIRQSIIDSIGADIKSIKPGSDAAKQLKELLHAKGMWSQYLEVGLGPDAEVFTKSQPMSAIGTGADIGLHKDSNWNNPEPELVMCVNQEGGIVGASLGNDVNLRDIEGRSALLLGRAKDNNASCVIGPFIRLFDQHFSLDTVRQAEVELNIIGADNYCLSAVSHMNKISRDVEDLVRQVIGKHHQYPDGFMLFTGTMYAPIEDRFGDGRGFTHLSNDIVQIYNRHLGSLINRVGYSDEVTPWTFGIGSLIKNLSGRGYL